MSVLKLITSIGTAVAAGRLAQMATSVDFGDVLGTVGLARRRSHALENLLFLGCGAAVGAGAALLLAPAPGRETRARLGKEISKLGEAASGAVRETTQSARALIHSRSHAGNGGQKNSKRAEE